MKSTSSKAILSTLFLLLSVFIIKAAPVVTIATDQGIRNDGSPIGGELNALVKANYGGTI